MKANSCGTMVEQYRARLGWKTVTERKACAADPMKICRTCKFFFTEGFTNRDGGCGVAVRCGHPNGGFATRETAGCDKWERDLS